MLPDNISFAKNATIAMLAWLIIILGGTDEKAKSTFSLKLLLEEMGKATQRYVLLEKLRKRQLFRWLSGNANTERGIGSSKVTLTLLSLVTATLLFVCDACAVATAFGIATRRQQIAFR